MRYSVAEWNTGYSPRALDDLARLWNANAVGRHAFFPWTGELLARQIAPDGRPAGVLLAARDGDGSLVGFAHIARVAENGYPAAGVVENILVDSCRRGAGVGTALLEAGVAALAALRPKPEFADALGAWPFGYVYNTLADGSERSGVFLREAALYRLFLRAGFHPVRKSVVMRADLTRAAGRETPRGCGYYIAKRTENTWLDRVFRGRELWDHDLARNDGRLLSRAIFGFMEGESRQEKQALFSLFGVNTPRDLQGKGYAGVNLSNLMAYARDLGGETMELHAYADNEPAMRLYAGLGFKVVAETMMMHKLLK